MTEPQPARPSTRGCLTWERRRPLNAGADERTSIGASRPSLKPLALAGGPEPSRTRPGSPGTRGREIPASGRIGITSGSGRRQHLLSHRCPCPASPRDLAAQVDHARVRVGACVGERGDLALTVSAGCCQRCSTSSRRKVISERPNRPVPR